MDNNKLYNAEHNFIELSDYLNSLASTLKMVDITDIDYNLYYEVIYASKELEHLQISEGDAFTKDMQDIKTMFDSIISAIGDKPVDELNTGPVYKELISKRKAITNAPGYGYARKGFIENPITRYIKSTIPKATVFIVLCMILATGVSRQFMDALTSLLFGESHDSEHAEMLAEMSSILTSFLEVSFTLICFIMLTGMCIDILYLSIPVVRVFVDGYKRFRLISNTARDIVNDYSIDKSVKTYDRIERNTYWHYQLSKLSITIKTRIQRCLVESSMPAGDITIGQLAERIDALDLSEDKALSAKDYIENLVEVEHLYNIAYNCNWIAPDKEEPEF